MEALVLRIFPGREGVFPKEILESHHAPACSAGSAIVGDGQKCCAAATLPRWSNSNCWLQKISQRARKREHNIIILLLLNEERRTRARSLSLDILQLA